MEWLTQAIQEGCRTALEFRIEPGRTAPSAGSGPPARAMLGSRSGEVARMAGHRGGRDDQQRAPLHSRRGDGSSPISPSFSRARWRTSLGSRRPA